VLHRLNSAATLTQRTTTEAPRGHMYYIGLDIHKKTISDERFPVPKPSGRSVGSQRCVSVSHPLVVSESRATW
jgi:hypothetical protein